MKNRFLLLVFIGLLCLPLSGCSELRKSPERSDTVESSPLLSSETSPLIEEKQAEETPRLVVYKDKKYNFTFSYAEGWELKEQNTISAKENRHIISLSQEGKTPTQKENTWVIVTERRSLEEKITEAKDTSKGVCDVQEEKGEAIQGISATKINLSEIKEECDNRGKCEEKCSPEREFFLFEKNGVVYEIGRNMSEISSKNLQNILSSFSFED